MYVKTQWVNNTTPINDTNLNKMEQGIYDNSLVVDAITNKLNPTDTETYKTAELTEGQITDVIGVNDIVIKGQTSQNGEPTPDSPVDVNVVSGSNVVNTSNKNLLNLPNGIYSHNGVTANIYNGIITLNGTASGTSAINIPIDITIKANQNYTLQANNSSVIGQSGTAASYACIRFRTSTIDDGYTDVRFNPINNYTTFQKTEETTYAYFKIRTGDGLTYNNYIIKPQVEQGSTATTYEPHQGKELPLDLPVENLLNISNDINTTTSGITVSLINTDTIDFNGVASSTYISTGTINLAKPLESGKTYCFKVFENNASNLRFRIWGYDSNNELKFNVIDGNSLTLNTNIVKYRLILEGLTTNNKYNVQAKFKVSEAPYINNYTPYGIASIELCKIGNYQDYFYKSGSKWYLHKENFKIIIPSSVNGSMQNSNKRFFVNKTQIGNYDILNTSSASQTFGLYCDILKEVTAGQTWSGTQGISYDYNDSSGTAGFDFAISGLTTVAEYQEALAGKIIIAKLNTPTDTEITDTTLISQLEAIYNAPLYEETNITQTNNDLPMILDITACKDNINGIKAFIRK